MNRRAASIAVAVTLVSVLFASVATSGGVQLWGEPQWDPTPREPTVVERETAEESLDDPFEFEQRDEPVGELPAWVGDVLRVVGVAVAMAAVIALIAAGWRNRPRLRWRRRRAGSDDFEVLPDIAAAVVDEAEAQRAALLGGEARNAIVRCWLQLESSVAAVGLVRPAADTSAEFTERVLGQYTLDPAALRELAALYREARFSDHQLDDSARSAALDALDRLHRELRDFARRAAQESSATETGTAAEVRA